MLDTMKNRKAFRIKIISCVLVAVAFLCGGLRSFIKVQDKIASWHRTDATIVGFASLHDADDSLFFPKLVFVTHEGEEVRTESSLGRNPTPFSEGETIRILYCPDSPTEILEDSWEDLYLPSMSWFVFAAVSALLAFSVYRKERQGKK